MGPPRGQKALRKELLSRLLLARIANSKRRETEKEEQA